MRFLPRLLADMAGREHSYADLKQKLDVRTKELNGALERETATFRELSESLERETATSEVLGIISTSPNDLEPILRPSSRMRRDSAKLVMPLCGFAKETAFARLRATARYRQAPWKDVDRCSVRAAGPIRPGRGDPAGGTCR